MHRLLTMKRLSVLFLATFAVLVGGVFVYQALVVAPGTHFTSAAPLALPRRAATNRGSDSRLR